MVRPQVADLVERQYEEQLPQLVPFRDLIQTLGRAAKKGSKYRLNDVLGVEPGRQSRGDLRRRQCLQTGCIFEKQLGGGVLLAFAETTQQTLVGPNRFGRFGFGDHVEGTLFGKPKGVTPSARFSLRSRSRLAYSMEPRRLNAVQHKTWLPAAALAGCQAGAHRWLDRKGFSAGLVKKQGRARQGRQVGQVDLRGCVSARCIRSSPFATTTMPLSVRVSPRRRS